MKIRGSYANPLCILRVKYLESLNFEKSVMEIVVVMEEEEDEEESEKKRGRGGEGGGGGGGYSHWGGQRCRYSCRDIWERRLHGSQSSDVILNALIASS